MNTADAGDLMPEPRPVSGGLPPSLAEIVTVRDGAHVQHELVLTPGATAADVTSVMILLPPTATLVSHHGDVDVSLVFQESAPALPEVPDSIEVPGEPPGEIPGDSAADAPDPQASRRPAADLEPPRPAPPQPTPSQPTPSQPTPSQASPPRPGPSQDGPSRHGSAGHSTTEHRAAEYKAAEQKRTGQGGAGHRTAGQKAGRGERVMSPRT